MKDEIGQFQDFADRFNSALPDAGLSKAQHRNLTEVLTKTFGVSKSTISDWRNGKKVPSMDSAIAISLRLNVCVEYLLTGRGPKRPGESETSPFDNWEDLTMEQKSACASFVHALSHKIDKPNTGGP
jgi:transcriptional regulator with XRE-family HTH domain